MLFRTASTPALNSFLVPLPERCRDLEVEAEIRHKASLSSQASSISCDEAARSVEGAVVNCDSPRRFRRVQSESDLSSSGKAGVSPAAACAADVFSTPETENGTTPQKQWSRRTSLRRYSSLPSAMSGSISLLDACIDELQAPIQESALSEAEEDSSRSSSDQGTCVSGRVDAFQGFEQGSGFTNWGSKEGPREFTPSRELRNVNVIHGSEEIGGMPMGGGFGIGIGTGGRWRGFGGGNSDPGNVDAYYRRMLEQDPGNPLVLRNYARYLYEVQRDLPRAEEFYERAILASPDDAELRSQYAKLIWEFRKDEERATSYFEQATQASPDDCSVLGAYAAFMWDVDDEQVQQQQHSAALAGPPATIVSA